MTDGKPNIIVHGVMHSGTTILTKMLFKLGWAMDRRGVMKDGKAVLDARRRKTGLGRFCEHPAVRMFNTAITQKSNPPTGEMAKFLGDPERLPEPWVIKHPAFVRTLEYWYTIAPDALVVWIYRPFEDVMRSMKRRRLKISDDKLNDMFAAAGIQFEKWPGVKIKIEYDRISDAARIFDPDRGKLGPHRLRGDL